MMLTKYKDPLLIFSFVLILHLFLFSGVLGAGYILDDRSVIQNREELRNFSSIYEVFTMPWHQGQPWAGNYRPLTLLSYSATLIFSESTAALRFVNILIHSANAALVFFLALMFFSRKTAYAAAIGFSLLPINTGTVLSLVGRSDLLGAFFLMLSIILFYKDRYFWSASSFFLALLAKDFSILLLPVIILLSWFSKNHKPKRVFKTACRYVSVLAPYFVLRYLALGKYAFESRGSVDPIIGPLAFAGLKERILTGLVYFYLYLRKTLIPFDLSPDYSFNQIPVPGILDPSLIIGLILLTAVLFMFFKVRNWKIKIPVILFLVPFGMISNTFFVTTGVFAERWWYFPSIGVVLFISVFLAKLLENKKSFYKFSIYPIILAVAFFYLYISLEQAKIWTNERRLFATAAQRSPNSAWARTNLAAAYFKEKNFDRAKNEIESSLKISENHSFALNIHAKLKWQEGKFGESELTLISAIKNDSNKRNHRDLYRSMAILKLETGDYDTALAYIRRAIESMAFGDVEKAIFLDNLLTAHIESLIQNKPDSLTVSEKEVIASLISHIKGF